MPWPLVVAPIPQIPPTPPTPQTRPAGTFWPTSGSHHPSCPLYPTRMWWEADRRGGPAAVPWAAGPAAGGTRRLRCWSGAHPRHSSAAGISGAQGDRSGARACHGAGGRGDPGQSQKTPSVAKPGPPHPGSACGSAWRSEAASSRGLAARICSLRPCVAWLIRWSADRGGAAKARSLFFLGQARARFTLIFKLFFWILQFMLWGCYRVLL